MLKSMTGFGRAEIEKDGLHCSVDISSVNRKQADVEMRLPREWSALEPELRRQVAAAVSRGRVQVNIQLRLPEGAASTVKMDRALAEAYISQLRTLPGLAELTLPAEALLRAPGVFSLEESSLPLESVQPLAEAALRQALALWDEARLREGQHLQADILIRLQTLDSLREKISAEAPQVAQHYRAGLMRRLEEAGLPLPMDDERLLKEIALYADRVDISEELTRLSGHLVEFHRLLGEKAPSGRAMDFLTQELNRELNTIGSKANNTTIAHSVVTGKTEVERIREQVQNAE